MQNVAAYERRHGGDVVLIWKAVGSAPPTGIFGYIHELGLLWC